jgi:hypothetical protein
MISPVPLGAPPERLGTCWAERPSLDSVEQSVREECDRLQRAQPNQLLVMCLEGQ